MLLPHGFEGQGPEHSSARLERYLQLSADDNWQVCNCTTPANYYHVLRRQVRRNFRKPLILMTPKSLLRHKACISKLDDFKEGTTFHRILWDELEGTDGLVADKDMRRVVMCSGKVYFDLEEERKKRGIKDVYLLRAEQIYPFPFTAVRKELSRFKNAEVVWCQEEPENNGGWFFVDRRIERVLGEIDHKPNQRPRYIGRLPSASPATGSAARHKLEQAKLCDEALSLPPLKKKTTTTKSPAKKAAARKKS